MNHKVKIIKRCDRQEAELHHPQQPSRDPTRELTTAIKLWVSEFKQRQRTTSVSNPRKVAV
ncbi:MAG: hypothetical protein QOD33_529 [Pyrinomonadaceae bacterium]|jgi:hypothetical protein|nr:hypothetical protein [Pyrinomonadaceae bacterium]